MGNLKPIKELLKEVIPEEKHKFIPSGYQKIGDIIIIELKKEIEEFENEIGKILLEKIPNVRTVCRKISKAYSEKKIPNIKVICGDKNTETIHRENNCFFKLDVSKILFSKGNSFERIRLVNQVKENETIVDMFAGIGYFSIPLAKFSKARRIFSIDINPVSIKYLIENISLNKVNNKIFPILSDCIKVNFKEKIADRIIMGYFPETEKYFEYALKFLKNKGIIHFHNTIQKSKRIEELIDLLEEIAKKNDYKIENVVSKRIVKKVGKNNFHIVLDLELSKIYH